MLLGGFLRLLVAVPAVMFFSSGSGEWRIVGLTNPELEL